MNFSVQDLGLEGSVLIVIPTFNEALNILRLLEAVHEKVPHAKALVVDDNSPDGTSALVGVYARKHPWVHLLTRSRKEGLGPAYFEGFRFAVQHKAMKVIQMDSDFSHDPAALPGLLAVGNADPTLDLIIGSRYVSGGKTEHWGLHRRLLSRWGNRYARWVLRSAIFDLTGGFNLWRRDFLEKILPLGTLSKGYAFQAELKHLACLHGARWKEMPIVFCDRTRGESKMSPRIGWEALYALWVIGRSSSSRKAALALTSQRAHGEYSSPH